jgi:hypothetical protein
MSSSKIKLGKIYYYPAANKYYAVTAYHPNGTEKIKSPIYEVIALEDPRPACYAARVTVEDEWMEVNAGIKN